MTSNNGNTPDTPVRLAAFLGIARNKPLDESLETAMRDYPDVVPWIFDSRVNFDTYMGTCASLGENPIVYLRRILAMIKASRR